MGIILKCIYKIRRNGHVWIYLGQKQGKVAGCCEEGYEISGSIKYGKSFD